MTITKWRVEMKVGYSSGVVMVNQYWTYRPLSIDKYQWSLYWDFTGYYNGTAGLNGGTYPGNMENSTTLRNGGKLSLNSTKSAIYYLCKFLFCLPIHWLKIMFDNCMAIAWLLSTVKPCSLQRDTPMRGHLLISISHGVSYSTCPGNCD